MTQSLSGTPLYLYSISPCTDVILGFPMLFSSIPLYCPTQSGDVVLYITCTFIDLLRRLESNDL